MSEKPSDGAMRAADKALLHLSGYRPTEKQRAQDKRALACIIDQETGAGELVEALRDIENKTRMMAGNPHWEAIAQDVQTVARAVLSRHTKP